MYTILNEETNIVFVKYNQSEITFTLFVIGIKFKQNRKNFVLKLLFGSLEKERHDVGLTMLMWNKYIEGF